MSEKREMIQVDFVKNDPNMGEIKGILRIDGQLLFLKFNNQEYAKNIISQMQQKGAVITTGRTWVRVNMFGVVEEVKLGDNEFNVKEKSKEELETILSDFYTLNFTKAGFTCTKKRIEQ